MAPLRQCMVASILNIQKSFSESMWKQRFCFNDFHDLQYSLIVIAPYVLARYTNIHGFISYFENIYKIVVLCLDN